MGFGDAVKKTPTVKVSLATKAHHLHLEWKTWDGYKRDFHKKEVGQEDVKVEWGKNWGYARFDMKIPAAQVVVYIQEKLDALEKRINDLGFEIDADADRGLEEKERRQEGEAPLGKKATP